MQIPKQLQDLATMRLLGKQTCIDIESRFSNTASV